MEEIESFDQVRSGKAADLDRFADLIGVTIVNLKDAGREAELGNGTFYTLLQKKLPETREFVDAVQSLGLRNRVSPRVYTACTLG